MERHLRTSNQEQNASPHATEQVRQALGGKALLCESCGQARPPTRGYVKVAVKVREQGEIRPSRPRVAEPVVMIRDAPNRKRASEANNAEKKARLDADHSVYRVIARRRTESR